MPGARLRQKHDMIVDAHVHLYPPEIGADPAGWAAARGEAQWATLCTRRRRSGRPVQGFPTVDELLREMDRAGVDRSVLLGWYWDTPAACVVQNRFYAACVRAHPDRLSAFAALQPRAGREATLAELERARADGLTGLGELSPHAQGVGVDDPVFNEVLEYAGRVRLPVNLHVTDPAGRAYPGRVDTPLSDFVLLARRHPSTTLVLAHWGGQLARSPEAGATRDLGNVLYDTAASPLLYAPAVWPTALEACGPDRVWFGSDYPLDLYPQNGDGPEMGRLLAEARAGGADAGVLGGNAARWLGLR